MTDDDHVALARFGGVARLFPLPTLVFFPHVVQGLHIFEPRYRQMMADALAGDMLLSLVLLKPGWEDDYDGRPAIETVACLGRITQHERLPDGRYNLRLQGLSRVRIREELPTGKRYRSAHVDLLPDAVPNDLKLLGQLRRRLADAVLPQFDAKSAAHIHLLELFHGELPLGALLDVLGYSLPLPLEVKQELLNEPGVEARAEYLLSMFGKPQDAPAPRFPPDFSPN